MVRVGRCIVMVALASTPAAADPVLTPITTRDYAIDLYEGTALGNSTVVGMGGAAVALSSGTSGTLINPSAPAVRSTTDTSWLSWDYHLDYLIGSLSTDYDNNGITSKDGTSSLITFGLGVRYWDWAIAAAATIQSAKVIDDTAATTDVALVASAVRLRISAARWVEKYDLAIGIAGQSAQFNLKPDCSDAGCDPLLAISGVGLEAGVQWLPRRRDFRIGVALSSPVLGADATPGPTCMPDDPATCRGFILPERVVSPWRIAVGGAYRWSRSRWNQLVGGWFRDEKALTVVADLVIAGPSNDGYGLEAFSNMQLQRSGVHAAVSPRAGVEYDWVPGRFRLRGGSYWEPGRFEGVGGRIHATAGFEARVFQFWLWGSRRRGKLGLTADIASRYRNIGISIGLWH